MPCATPWRPESAADGHPEQWDGRAAAEQPGHMRDSGPASEAAAIMEATNTPGAGGWHGALPRHNQYDQDADPRRHDFHPAGTDRRSWADGADLGARSYGHHGAAPVPDNAQHLQVPREPTHPLYREAQLIFDSIEYFNENVSGDLISIKSHFNPYRVDMTRIENIPRIYISMLVTVATSHRAMQEAADGQLAQSTSALVRLRQQDIFAFRIKAIQEVNQRLSLQETQTSDSTLMCVLCLLMCTIQQSTYSDWRLHLEGAREIIKLRGGLGRIASESHHFRPLFVIFVAIDVLSATTTSTKHPKMTEAVLMALHYWEAAPNMFQANLAISAPCPEELFQAIILVNYLRTIVRRPKMQTRRHAGTRMVLQKIQSFNIPQWAARMKNFKGWKRSGESVEFEDDTTPARTLSSSSESSSSRTSPADEHHTMSTADSESPMTTATSPRAQTPDLWLDVGVMYHCAVLLYALRTLLLDIDEDKSFLLSDSASASHWSSQDGLELEQEIEQLRQKTHSTLLDTMGPIFSDHEAAREVGKLVFFPAFMCGMELCGFFPAADLEANMAKQTLVSNGLELVGQACGTMAPICAAEEVRTKWALEAEEGRMVRWDDFLATRPDFTFGF